MTLPKSYPTPSRASTPARKTLTDREQATREYNEVLARFFSAGDPSEMERLIPELDAALQRIPPDSIREKKKAARAQSLAVKRMDLAGSRAGILPALAKGDVEPFFRDIDILPELFLDKDICEQTIVTWLENKTLKNARGDTARENLKRLAQILINIHGAPEYETEEERVAARREREKVKSKEYYDRKKKRSG